MAKRYQHQFDIDGTPVPYSAKPRPASKVWAVVFPDPDNNRKQLNTGCELRGKTPPPEFHTEAQQLIRQTYRPGSGLPVIGDYLKWDDALDAVKRHSPTARSETIRGYEAGVKTFRALMPEVRSPQDISAERVSRFGRLFLSTQGPRGQRSPATLSYYVRSLSGFSNHLIELGLLRSNPWKGAKVPKWERKKKPAPAEAVVFKFFDWLTERYPDWKSLHVLCQLKAISACRTADLCKLKTANLSDDHITFEGATVKTATTRHVPLPPDLVADLRSVAGPVWLWSGFFEDIKTHRKQSNKLPSQFSWLTVKWVIENLFREFSDDNPDLPRLSPHALRRRAITQTVIALGGSVDAAAAAIGMHPQTARSHYLDAQQAFQTQEVMRRTVDALRLKGTEARPAPTGSAKNS